MSGHSVPKAIAQLVVFGCSATTLASSELRDPLPPILVEDLDAVIGGDRWHDIDPSRCFTPERQQR